MIRYAVLHGELPVAHRSRHRYRPHPHDPDVWIGEIGALDAMSGNVDAVVTMCRYGSKQVPAGPEHIVFHLIDTHDEDNPNVDFVIHDAARTIAALRDEGKRVLLHCVAGHSRTPTVAVRYSMLLGMSLDLALPEVTAVLPYSNPNRSFRRALRRLEKRSPAYVGGRN